MAVNVDTVYQRVLTLANKEQRGYITPQEFNLLANQAQMAILDSYFSDKKGTVRNDPGNNTEYSDSSTTLDEKLSVFEVFNEPITVVTGAGTFPNNYKIGTLFYQTPNTNTLTEIELVSQKDIILFNQTPLAQPSLTRPVYITTSGTAFQIFPDDIDSGITCNYLRIPTRVEWGYVITRGEALYNASASTDFELHRSEETLLVIKILELAGIVINKPGIVQIAGNEEAEVITRKNQ